jgi:signal transduction histidine kinase
MFEALEDRFLAQVNQSLWITGLASLMLGIGLSVILARQITGPLLVLQHSAHRIAAGDLSGRVVVRSSDEVGDLARSFNLMAEALERNEIARRNLMADVAHELRTPLTVIEGMVSAVLDGVFEPDTDNLSIIKDQTQLLAKLVDDLRELSLAEGGQLRLDLAPTSVSDIVEQVADNAGPAALSRGIEIQVEIEPNTPLLLADPIRLQQALNNLVSNAIRHTSNGGMINLECRRVGDKLLVMVGDTGEGIAEEDQPYVFDRFYRSDKSRARRSGGTGLGLAIVKQLIEAHGGEVWVESEAGRGSRFYVTLPLSKRQSDAV